MAYTGLASATQIYKRLLETNGLDAARLLHEAGLQANVPDDPNARLPIRILDTVLIRAAALIPEEGWGLAAARCWHPGHLGVLGHAWLASSTLLTGLTRLTRYWRILGDRAQTRVEETDAGITFTYVLTAAHPAVEAILPDCVLAIVLDMCRANAGERICPVRVTLRRGPPAIPGPWVHFFGCAPECGAGRNSFTLSRTVAERLLPTANRPLAGVLDGLLVEQLAKLSRKDVISRCKAEFLEQLASGEPSAADIAKRLHMSSRTLQRRLAQSNTTYLKLVDDTRRDLALRYVENRDKSMSDITFLLGFSGQSAFTRAFKRWTGLSPTAYRQRIGIPA